MYLEPGTTCWRIERADRATVILDMADYFKAAKAAMEAKSILGAVRGQVTRQQ